jgi:phosphate starvation-inducible membrane PsiE
VKILLTDDDEEDTNVTLNVVYIEVFRNAYRHIAYRYMLYLHITDVFRLLIYYLYK